MKKIIIGLGTGRCGTMSLAKILDGQENTSISHEFCRSDLPWNKDINKFEKLYDLMNKRKEGIVGDVSFYLLPYVNESLKRNSGTKFIIIKRNKEETIKSYLKKTEGRNHWNNHDGKIWRSSSWDHCYPKFQTATKEEALSKYYDLYYEICSNIPSEICFWMDTEDLNDKNKIIKMLEFCEYDNPKFFIVKENKLLSK